MSKKKSYMNYKNVLLENKFIDAFKHLLGFNKAKLPKLSGEEKKLMKIPAIKKLVTSLYSDYEKLKRETNKEIQKLRDQGSNIDFME